MNTFTYTYYQLQTYTADLGTFSMFGCTAKPTKREPQTASHKRRLSYRRFLWVLSVLCSIWLSYWKACFKLQQQKYARIDDNSTLCALPANCTERGVICRLTVIGVASVRQEEPIASSSWNCVLASSVKSSLNTAPKCSILRSNNKKNSSPLPRFLPGGEGAPTSPHPTSLGSLGCRCLVCPLCLLLNWSLAAPFANCR